MAANNQANGAKNKMITLLVIWVILGIVLTVALYRWGAPLGIRELISTKEPSALATAWYLPNFLILCTLLWYFGRGPLKEHLVARRAALAEAIAGAERRRLEAEDRHREYEEKLLRIEQEIASLLQTLREEGEREKERVLLKAREEAERIKHDAEFTAKQELRKAQAALREEAAALTVELAEKIIRQTITGEDQERILRDYLARVELKP
jgi:F-type H+-transporting ATPase subunit b